jgi:hypothetical protein
MTKVTDSERIDKLYRDVYEGNGKPAIKTRIEMLEENLCRFSASVADLTTNVSALLRYQVEDETRTKLFDNIKKDKISRNRWQVAQMVGIALAIATALLSCSPKLEYIRYTGDVVHAVELKFKTERQAEKAFYELRELGAYCEKTVYGTLMVSDVDKEIWLKYVQK